MKKNISFLIALITMIGLPSFAKDEVSEFEVGDAPHLILTNTSGKITVKPGSKGLVVIKAVQKTDEIKVIKEQEGDTITVRTEYPSGRYRGKGVSFEIEFPGEGRLDIESVAGSIEVKGVDGRHQLNTISGNVKLSDAQGDFTIGATSGKVALKQIGPSEMEVTVLTGNIDYSQGNLEGGDYHFSVTTGNINITHGDRASYRISGRTTNGKIFDETGGNFDIRKPKYGPNKSIRGTFNDGDVWVRATTVVGNITIKVN